MPIWIPSTSYLDSLKVAMETGDQKLPMPMCGADKHSENRPNMLPRWYLDRKSGAQSHVAENERQPIMSPKCSP